MDKISAIPSYAISPILYLNLMLRVLFFFFLFFECSCRNSTNKDRIQQNASVHWQYLTLEFNDTVIHLSRPIDTLKVSTSQKGVQNYQISKAEKESLFERADKLMDFKEKTIPFCTDYVGGLKIRIRYNSQVIKEVDFSSICNWRELGASTKEIGRLLDKIIRTK